MLGLCWFSYVTAYTLRVNFAAVIPAMTAAGQLGFSQVGIITGLFFFTYMTGQLVSGYLGDRASAKLLIIGGLTVSSLCNIGMGLSSGFLMTAVCWGINGFAQAMLWAPIMKSLSDWFPSHELEHVSFIMARTILVGFALSWGISSLLAFYFSWTWAFYIPSASALLYCTFLMVLFKEKPRTQPGPARKHLPGHIPILQYFKVIGLPGLLFIAFFQGLLREGITVWYPTLVQEFLPRASAASWSILLFVPVLQWGGLSLVRKTNSLMDNEPLKTIMAVFCIMCIIAVLLTLVNAAAPVLIGIMMLFALSHGLTPITTSVIPFQYKDHGRVSLTVGVIEFSIYLGAGFSGIITGFTADRYGWGLVIIIWIFTASAGLAAAALRYVSHMRRNTYAEQTN